MSPQQIIKFFNLDTIEVKTTVVKLLGYFGGVAFLSWQISEKKTIWEYDNASTRTSIIELRRDVDTLKQHRIYVDRKMDQHDMKFDLLSQLTTLQNRKLK